MEARDETMGAHAARIETLVSDNRLAAAEAHKARQALDILKSTLYSATIQYMY